VVRNCVLGVAMYHISRVGRVSCGLQCSSSIAFGLLVVVILV
jgi:hypothetical protein